MKMKIFIAIFYLILLQLNCTPKKSEKINDIVNEASAKQTFFPVTDYIKGQLNEIDSLPITPLKIITYNGKQDSAWLKKEAIRIFAQPFLHPEIDTANFKKLFTQKSFLDQTIDAFTFSYDPADKLPDSLKLKRWDVYVDPKKNTIKRIYIVQQNIANGNLQTIQLTWKSNQWCKITTITEGKSKQPDIKEEMIKWSFNE